MQSLSSTTQSQHSNKSAKALGVAVAVICYRTQFLLAWRDNHQHQGGLYEFVGGKIESDESPKDALIREVSEELGIDIGQQAIAKMGDIDYDYVDKAVLLHVFWVALDNEQFDSLQSGKGAENQQISWVSKDDLLANRYRLPKANEPIMGWIQARFDVLSLDTP